MTFMLSFLVFISNELKAQNDAYFSTTNEYRSPDAMGQSINSFRGKIGNGFDFENFISDHNGFDFEEFIDGDASVTNGLLIITATSLIYLRNKRRKENE